MPGPILLPPSFQNSFWSQDDFKSGMEVLFGKLEQGCLENQEVVAFIKSQATAYHTTATSLSSMPATSTFENSLSTGLSASLAQSFTHMQSIAQRQAVYYEGIASELERKVLEGFIRWANVHESRVRVTAEEVLGYVPKPFEERSNSKFKGEGSLVGDYGSLALEVAKLRQTYLAKANHADDLEEEARFHTTIATPKQDIFTPEPRPASPQLQALTSPQAGRFPSSISPGSGLKRTGTVAERISEKLRMASVNRSAAAMESMMIKEESEEDRSSRPTGEKLLPAPPISNHTPGTTHSSSGIVTSGLTSTDPSAPLLLAGLSLPLQGLISLLTDFARHLSLTLPQAKGDETHDGDKDDESSLRSRTRTTIFGTFDDSFSGTELVDWMLSKLEGFGGQADRADEACSELLRWGLIGRIGMGRGWEANHDTFYVLKDSATDDSPFAIEALRNHIHALTASVRTHNRSSSVDAAPSSPSKLSSPSVASLAAASSMLQNYLPQALKNASSADPAHVKARREAKTADAEYREALGELESMRLGIESRLEAGLAQWENWERERLRAVKTVLAQYEQVVSSLPKRLTDLATGVKIAVEAYKPDADLLAMIEGNRTGHFRPKAHIYDSLDSDDYDVTFGIDLRKWGGQQGWKAIMRKEAASEGSSRDIIPHVLTALLRGLDQKYKEVSDDVRRKSWLYLVSLREIHPLRELINDPHVPVEEMVKEVTKFNPPVIAATIKLWLLELNPPVLGYDCYETMKSFYRKGDDRNDGSEETLRVLTETLSKLSSPQIMVLDTVLAHFQTLISDTKTEESNEAYTTKLCLSIGRHFLRPQVETAQTLQDLAPSRLLEDLLKHRNVLLPPLVERAQKVLERAMPQRKNTRPVDQRISRSKLSVSGEDGREILRTQVPRTPSRVSAPASHAIERSQNSSTEQDESPLVSEAKSQSVEDPPRQDTIAVSTTGPEPASALVTGAPYQVSQTDAAPPVQATNVEADSNLAGAPAATENPEMTGNEVERRREPVESDDVVLSIDNDTAGFANGGARLSRKRPVSKELDQPIQEGESTLRRNASGEAHKGVVRGPRLATRGPRPVPSKIAAEISSPTSARPSSPSIRDRIANLEKANTGQGADRFV